MIYLDKAIYTIPMTKETQSQQPASPEDERENARRLRRAEAIISQLVKEGAAYQKTIDKITDAWEEKESALEAAQSILDQEVENLANDEDFIANSQIRAHEMIAPKLPSGPKPAKR